MMNAAGPIRPRLIPSTRFLLALLVCFGFIVQYAQRTNMSIAIVCMVNRQKINFNRNQTNHQIQSATETNQRTTLLFDEKAFPWNEWDQQIILGSYWAGYLLTLVPSGWWSIRLGAKLMSAAAICVSSLATIALSSIYFVEESSFFLVIGLRILIGAAHGILFPVTYTLWSQWAVPDERGTLTAVGFCGTNIGTAFIVLTGGLFCRYVSSGWMYIMLLSGALGFVWLPLWLWQVSNSPVDHRSISTEERDYIVGIIGKNAQNARRRPVSLGSLPWKEIVRSKPVIALLLTEFCNLFGLFFFLSNLGKMLTEIQRIPSQYTGYILACGFISMLIGSLSSGIIADHLVRKNVIKLVTARKLFNSLASFIPCLCMLAFCFCDENRRPLGVVTVILLLLSSGFAYGSGYIVNFSDIVPAYAGLIFGIVTMISSFGGLLANVIAGVLIKHPTLDNWRKLYIIFSVVYLFGGLVFLVFGSAAPEKWATFKSQEQEQNDAQSPEEAIPMQAEGEKDALKTAEGTGADEHSYVNA